MRRLAFFLSCLALAGCPAYSDDDDGPPDHPTDGGPPDSRPDDGSCTDWQVGTLTGYNNSDSGDDPNSGSVMEFTGLNEEFYANVDMAAIDFSDWGGDKYRWVDVDFQGTIGRVGVWDACRNEDCPDGRQCCTENKERFAQPGYLVDVETRTAQRLWGVFDAENTLNDRIEYRVCGSFDPDEIADRYGVRRSQ